MLELAAMIATQLQQHNISAILVGGFAVAIYTENRYLTKDIDMVDISYQSKKLAQAMAELGFVKQGRIYINPTTDISVEFPSAPLAVGDELISSTTIYKHAKGSIPILHSKDLVKDRLAAYFHWKDLQSLIQALCIMLCHEVNPNDIKNFCQKEASESKAKEVISLFYALRSSDIKEMEDIEDFVIARQAKRI